MHNVWPAVGFLLAVLGAAPACGAEPSLAPVMVIADEQMPLAQVLQRIEARFPGRALDAKFRKRDEQPVYRVKWLGADGKVRVITADARSGKIVAVR